MKAQLAEIEAAFAKRDVESAMNQLGALMEAGKDRDQLMAWIVAHAGDEHPQIAAHIALAGGALVEGGAPAGAIGRAIVAPVERALRDAARMIGYAQQYGHAHTHDDHDHDHADSEDEHEHEHEHEHDDEHEHEHEHEHADEHDHDSHSHALEIRGYALSDDDLSAIAAKDVAAVRAWFSLDMWYRPAVATWTRDRAVLREIQGNAGLRAAVQALASETPTSHWLSILLEATADAPFVVVIPELEEAWAFTADGIVDIGQLTVLLSKELADPLARIGASGVATGEELAVMSGDGPQSGGGGYSSSFAFYPPEAVEPSDGMPRDGVHTWSAPGGTGAHSLPGDFLPGTLPVVDGARVLVMVGPKAPGLRFVRIIQSARMFDALPARITSVRKLPEETARRWSQLASAIGAQARV